MTAALTRARLASPIGTMLVVSDGNGCLRALDWEDCAERQHRLLARYCGDIVLVDGAAPPSVENALAAYFAGDVAAIEAIEVATGGTPFQRAVWSALRKIPAGRTESYSSLARALGRSEAARAVGAANGANPISIVVPCHRLVGTDGALTGYAGGVRRKRWLLEHEGALPAIGTRRSRPRS